MAAPKNNRVHVNLLHPQGIPDQFPVRFFKWLVSFGKYIVIVVELVVVVAFVIRFKLDADLRSINQSINERVEFINSKLPDEILVKRTQFKLTTVKKEFDLVAPWKDIMNKISSQLTPASHLNTLTIDSVKNTKQISFKMVGVAPSTNDLGALVDGLNSEALFRDITLSNLVYDQGDLVFTITGGTK